MKKIFILFTLLFGSIISYAQDLYLVKLKTKENTANYFSNPLQMLSQRALDRRAKYNIQLDEKDIPISTTRIQQIKNLDLAYIGQTKWLNTIMVEITDPSIVTALTNLSFVESVKTMVRNSSGTPSQKKEPKWIDLNANKTEFNYGYAAEFINQINLKPLHQAGFMGNGVFVGVIDAGFPNVNTISAFEKLRSENRIFDTYDFVENKKDVYGADNHGTMVLSTMAAEVDGDYVGSAPKATYSLYRSEDNNSETPKELIYWIQAAERADSVGVDVINTSLGYTEFDDPRYNYTYADMDGKTTLISQGAEVGASRGILLVNAAGNEGNNPWKMISAPADVKDVFTIGANTSSKNPASFTSFGPNSANVLKPNVSALGQNIVVYNPTGDLSYSNGTSFASPVTAGAMAVMLQKFPKVSLDILKDNVQKSAHLSANPSYQLGYGIPDYEKANQELLAINEVSIQNQVKIYPNPFIDILNIQSKNEIKAIEIYNLVGQKLISSNNQKTISTSQLKSGIYLIKVLDNKANVFTEKVIKK